MNNTQKLLWEG